MTKKTKDAFLAALSLNEDPPAAAQPPPLRVVDTTRRASSGPARKHIGGYFEPEDVERFAILKARLNKDNSELIKFAIDELFAQENARRSFGD